MLKLLSGVAIFFAFYLLLCVFVSADWRIIQKDGINYSITFNRVAIGIPEANLTNAMLDVVNWGRMQGLRVHTLIVDGSVGIGTTVPGAKLTVNGTGPSHLLQVRNATHDFLVVNGTTGNVGIGTMNPTEKLDVAGKVKAQGFCIGNDCRTSWGGQITGYERKEEICLGSGNFGNCNVSCNSNKKVLGGGCACYSSTSYYYPSITSVTSMPYSDTMWYCDCGFQEAITFTIRAYAICAQI